MWAWRRLWLMIKLAFGGKKHSGKTTLAEYCTEVHSLEPISFADVLKMNLIEIGVDPDRVFEVRDANSRALMQAYGETMRDQDKDYWLDIVLKNIREWVQYPHNIEGIVIDDMRYENEATALKADGFTLIKIVREGYNHEEDFHPSEAGLPDEVYDHILVAKNKDLNALYVMIDEIIEELEVKTNA
jgi:hypothetical protein